MSEPAVRGPAFENLRSALRELHAAESDLTHTLLGVAERRRAEHEIFYVCHDLARWSEDHVRRVAEAGRAQGLDLDEEVRRPQQGARHARESSDLLTDLRLIHLEASAVSLHWEVLAQTAQGLKDSELLALSDLCHPQTLRQLRWANATLKDTCVQLMLSG